MVGERHHIARLRVPLAERRPREPSGAGATRLAAPTVQRKARRNGTAPAPSFDPSRLTPLPEAGRGEPDRGRGCGHCLWGACHCLPALRCPVSRPPLAGPASSATQPSHWCGLLGLIAALGMGASDLVMLARPVSGREFATRGIGNLAFISDWRLAAGAVAGVAFVELVPGKGAARRRFSLIWKNAASS